MPIITLPDGKQLEFDQPVSIYDVATRIGAGLAKAALGGKINDQIFDTSYLIEQDASLKIITDRDPEGLNIIRHSTAHLMAQAVKQLFPSAQVTIGPMIDNGFYYDFAYAHPFTPEDLEKIEKRMAELAKKDLPISRKVMSRVDAVKFFQSLGEDYKVQIIKELPETETISLMSKAILLIFAAVHMCRVRAN